MRLSRGWIFSARTDTAVFLIPTVFGLLFCWWSKATGLFQPGSRWWVYVLLFGVGCDVAHCYATFARTHLDGNEWRLRRHLLLGIPVALYTVLLGLSWRFSSVAMWYLLLYLAAYHFVRQQIGWISWTARRAGEAPSFDLKFDRIMIYNATLYPLLVWHSGTIGDIWWEGLPFFKVVPLSWLPALLAIHWTITVAYVLRQIVIVYRTGTANLAKYMIVLTTWLNWYVGILILSSGAAFLLALTVTHAIPYIVLVYQYFLKTVSTKARWGVTIGFPTFVTALFLMGYFERSIRNVFVLHEKTPLYPFSFIDLDPTLVFFLVPLGALPTACHFVFDTYIWKINRKAEPLRELMRF